MRSLIRSLSRAMLFVMLVTVFAPSFGWEAVSATVGHEEMAVADQDVHMAHEAHADCDGCDSHAAAPCDDLRHHCCPGHVLGHMSGGITSISTPILPLPRLFAVNGQTDRFSSRIPEGLERPPRFAA
ncbi:hypothetical protein KI614_06970 [Dechloromonas denitrificans]|uniref:hypothetical protein n=1 Tax=Dechloromonas denitrificans TaxID=281362 RepID=UPI001CF8F094|nr:hypothetical protein [Dechloromonas denitrificans]UCV12940.1 hypothetical protein KI614_06970 [Dechloromonas denitrificans]